MKKTVIISSLLLISLLTIFGVLSTQIVASALGDNSQFNHHKYPINIVYIQENELGYIFDNPPLPPGLHLTVNQSVSIFNTAERSIEISEPPILAKEDGSADYYLTMNMRYQLDTTQMPQVLPAKYIDDEALYLSHDTFRETISIYVLEDDLPSMQSRICAEFKRRITDKLLDQGYILTSLEFGALTNRYEPYIQRSLGQC